MCRTIFQTNLSQYKQVSSKGFLSPKIIMVTLSSIVVLCVEFSVVTGLKKISKDFLLYKIFNLLTSIFSGVFCRLLVWLPLCIHTFNENMIFTFDAYNVRQRFFICSRLKVVYYWILVKAIAHALLGCQLYTSEMIKM